MRITTALGLASVFFFNTCFFSRCAGAIAEPVTRALVVTNALTTTLAILALLAAVANPASATTTSISTIQAHATKRPENARNACITRKALTAKLVRKDSTEMRPSRTAVRALAIC